MRAIREPGDVSAVVLDAEKALDSEEAGGEIRGVGHAES